MNSLYLFDNPRFQVYKYIYVFNLDLMKSAFLHSKNTRISVTRVFLSWPDKKLDNKLIFDILCHSCDHFYSMFAKDHHLNMCT